MAIEKVRGGSFVGLSGTRDSAKKFEALTNVDGARRKETPAFISFFFSPPDAQTAVNRFKGAK
jgi:hypothetical protein